MQKQTFKVRYRDRAPNTSEGTANMAFCVVPQLLYERKRMGQGVDWIWQEGNETWVIHIIAKKLSSS